MKNFILPIVMAVSTILSSYTADVQEMRHPLGIGSITNDFSSTTEVRHVSNFEKLTVSSAFIVKISDGHQNGQIKITAPDHALQKIKSKVVNGELKLYVEGKLQLNSNKILIEFPHQKLRNLSISGACNVTIDHQMKVDKFKADVSGASKLKANILSHDASIEISGSSTVQLLGNVGNLDVEATGASKFEGEQLKANIAEVEASGASKIKVWAVNALDIEASGASKVEYVNQRGLNPKIKKSGVSKVSVKS